MASKVVSSPEILAPAGGMEQLVAAVRCGADAVYLGAKKFSARQNAANFDDYDLQKGIDYCHLHRVKAYAALNTVISDAEIPLALKQAEYLVNAGIDALIIQDIGLAGEIKKLSDIPLHASTQMSVGTSHGFSELSEMGFKRAVLPRELSFSEIRAITEGSNTETECFVHGALCMSVSGQCYMSAMLGSRSGNRGLCAQPCRLPFGRGYESDRFLSLKDLSLIKDLKALSDIGVTSFKIEGRMKRAEYVAAAVTACRASLNGELSEEMLERLQSVFSRSGFTNGHFAGKRDKSMFGIRQKEDVEKSANVLGALRCLYKDEISSRGISFEFKLREKEPALLKAEADGFCAEAHGSVPAERAVKKELCEDAAVSQISKCGGTGFYSKNISCDIEKGLALPLSQLNLLRRECIGTLTDKICGERKYAFSDVQESDYSGFSAKAERQKDTELFAYFPSLSVFSDGAVAVAYLPLSECASDGFDAEKYKTEIFASLPRMFFGREKEVLRLAERAKENGVCGFLVGGLDGLSLVRNLSLPVHSSFGMNVFNSFSLSRLYSLGVSHTVLSPELGVKQIRDMGKSDIKKGIFAYGRLPLMLTRACPMQNLGGCRVCKSPSLTDRKGIRFPVKCDFGFTEILNSKCIYTADKLADIQNADYILLYFTNESRKEALDIINAYKNALPPAGEFTRGLLYRGCI